MTCSNLDGVVHVFNLEVWLLGDCSGGDMRNVLVFMPLVLAAACEGSFVRAGDLRRKVNIDRSYEARDACLARNAAADGTAERIRRRWRMTWRCPAAPKPTS